VQPATVATYPDPVVEPLRTAARRLSNKDWISQWRDWCVPDPIHDEGRPRLVALTLYFVRARLAKNEWMRNDKPIPEIRIATDIFPRCAVSVVQISPYSNQ
jgi:hypothetical protein